MSLTCIYLCCPQCLWFWGSHLLLVLLYFRSLLLASLMQLSMVRVFMLLFLLIYLSRSKRAVFRRAAFMKGIAHMGVAGVHTNFHPHCVVHHHSRRVKKATDLRV